MLYQVKKAQAKLTRSRNYNQIQVQRRRTWKSPFTPLGCIQLIDIFCQKKVDY